MYVFFNWVTAFCIKYCIYSCWFSFLFMFHSCFCLSCVFALTMENVPIHSVLLKCGYCTKAVLIAISQSLCKFFHEYGSHETLKGERFKFKLKRNHQGVEKKTQKTNFLGPSSCGTVTEKKINNFPKKNSLKGKISNS